MPPTESNRLYTPYIDLRAAALADVRAYDEPAGDAGGRVASPRERPRSPSFARTRVDAIALDDAARAAGVTLETLGALIARDPATRPAAHRGRGHRSPPRTRSRS